MTKKNIVYIDKSGDTRFGWTVWTIMETSNNTYPLTSEMISNIVTSDYGMRALDETVWIVSAAHLWTEAQADRLVDSLLVNSLFSEPMLITTPDYPPFRLDAPPNNSKYYVFIVTPEMDGQTDYVHGFTNDALTKEHILKYYPNALEIRVTAKYPNDYDDDFNWELKP